jgi:hypothetical protein
MIGAEKTANAELLTFAPLTIHQAVLGAMPAPVETKVPVACRTLVLAETTQGIARYQTHAMVETPVAIVTDQILVTSEIRMMILATYRIHASAMVKKKIAGLTSVKSVKGWA